MQRADVARVEPGAPAARVVPQPGQVAAPGRQRRAEIVGRAGVHDRAAVVEVVGEQVGRIERDVQRPDAFHLVLIGRRQIEPRRLELAEVAQRRLDAVDRIALVRVALDQLAVRIDLLLVALGEDRPDLRRADRLLEIDVPVVRGERQASDLRRLEHDAGRQGLGLLRLEIGVTARGRALLDRAERRVDGHVRGLALRGGRRVERDRLAARALRPGVARILDRREAGRLPGVQLADRWRAERRRVGAAQRDALDGADQRAGLPRHAGAERVVAEPARREVELDPLQRALAGVRHDRELAETLEHVVRALGRLGRVARALTGGGHRIGRVLAVLVAIVAADRDRDVAVVRQLDQAAVCVGVDRLLLVDARRDAGEPDVAQRLGIDRARGAQDVDRHAAVDRRRDRPAMCRAAAVVEARADRLGQPADDQRASRRDRRVAAAVQVRHLPLPVVDHREVAGQRALQATDELERVVVLCADPRPELLEPALVAEQVVAGFSLLDACCSMFGF